jgi:GT2 family glycosyltransferase
MKRKTILMGIPNNSGVIPAQMVQSLLQLHKPLPCAVMIIERQMILKARNALAMETLNGNFDYLFFVDDDNPIPPNTLELMVQDDKDIVVAPILSRNPNKKGVHDLCSFYARTIDVGFPLRLYDHIDKFKEEGPLHKIDGGGTGCMLIKRKVLEELFKKYKDYIFELGDVRFEKKIIDGVEYDRRTMSEDAEFCERAIDAGFEVWLDDRIRPYHLTGVQAVRWGDK